ncbi:MAG: NHLP leader peptide family natural product precursor [Gammaproteobacteria bacterium]|nr:NHLP leader peptide family natural product precursor [Gammaproteobacteria bacterium]
MLNGIEIEDKVRIKADEDDSFRELVVQNPRKAIEEATGLVIPDEFNIHVHEESATDFHLVLPQKGGRLSDQELRDAAAGYAPSNGNW